MKIVKGMVGGALVFGVGALLVGCERADPRLGNLHTGMPKDSVIAAMEGAPHRLDPYLYQGQYIETMYYPQQGKAGPETLTDRNMAPVVLINGTLAGWGWAFWDSVSAANNIEVPAK